MAPVDARTELVGVVGHPVAHSLSPHFWNAAFAATGRNAVFLAFDVDPDGFETFVAGMRAGGARGLNVTLPHKAAAFDLATTRSADAEATGAVNVLVMAADALEGHNTDVVGLRCALDDLGVPAGIRAVVLGAGGAGRAAVRALDGLADEILIANRTRAGAERLAEAVSGEVVLWEKREAAAVECDLVVQATSMGLVTDQAPLGPAGLGGRTRYLLDVVYAPGETPLVRAARAAGIAAADGLSMLVHQAAAAWRLFFGEDAPTETMRSAAYKAVGREE